jgi:hypothetical protein
VGRAAIVRRIQDTFCQVCGVRPRCNPAETSIEHHGRRIHGALPGVLRNSSLSRRIPPTASLVPDWDVLVMIVVVFVFVGGEERRCR